MGTRFSRGMLMLALVLTAASTAAWSARDEVAAEVASAPVLADPYPARTVWFDGGVQGSADLVYSTPAGFRPLRLDLYTPTKALSSKLGRPLVIYIHGGGWQSGHTRHAGAFANWPVVLATLAARGYVVASIEYRLSGEARFPAAIHDVKTAIRWLRSRAQEFSVDPTRIVVWGGSAGAQLAALAAMSCDAAALAPAHSADATQTPSPDAGADRSDCVQGLVAWYGVFDFAERARSASGKGAVVPDSAVEKFLGCQPAQCEATAALASPLTHVDSRDPPVLLIHGELDAVVSVEQSRVFQRVLQSHDVPVKLIVAPGVDHSFIAPAAEATRKASLAALAATFDFIDVTIGDKQP